MILMYFTVISGFLNKPKVYNTGPLNHALHRRPLSVPLITVSNHHSCFDDPGLWGKVYLFTRNGIQTSYVCICHIFNIYYVTLIQLHIQKCIRSYVDSLIRQFVPIFCYSYAKMAHVALRKKNEMVSRCS